MPAVDKLYLFIEKTGTRSFVLPEKRYGLRVHRILINVTLSRIENFCCRFSVFKLLLATFVFCKLFGEKEESSSRMNFAGKAMTRDVTVYVNKH